jgi:hypothetical protein
VSARHDGFAREADVIEPIEALASSLLSPRLIDLALVIVAIEALVLLRLSRARGVKRRWVMGQIAAGVVLLVAVRIILAGGSDVVVLLLLALSFPLHLMDVATRLRRGVVRPG